MAITPRVWQERGRLLIEALRQNRDLSLVKAYRAANLKFVNWRRIAPHVPGFKEDYIAEREARGSLMTRGSPAGILKFETRPGNEEKLDLFFKYWPEEGTLYKAVARVNEEVPAGTTLWPELIMNRINASSDSFDAVFYERYKFVEGAMSAKVLDGILINATTPDEKRGTPGGNPQSQKLWAENRMSTLFENRRRVSHDHNHGVNLSLNVSVKVTQESDLLFSGGRVVEVQGEVIDALPQGNEPHSQATKALPPAVQAEGEHRPESAEGSPG